MKFWQVEVITTILVFTTKADASLIDRGNNLIYDADLDITWLQDAYYAFISGFDFDGKLNWKESLSSISRFEYSDYTDWLSPLAGQQGGSNNHLTSLELGVISGFIYRVVKIRSSV